MDYPEPQPRTQPGYGREAANRPVRARLTPALLLATLVLVSVALLAVALIGRPAIERTVGRPEALPETRGLASLATPTPSRLVAVGPPTQAPRASVTPAVLGSSFAAAVPTRTPVPAPRTRPTAAPTAVPAERVSLELSAEVDPPVPRVGSRLSIRLSMKNVGRQDVRGVQILTGGPWEVMSGVEVTPQGTLRRGPAGWYILSNTLVPAGETRVLEISGVPLERGNQAFTFLADALQTLDR